MRNLAQGRAAGSWGVKRCSSSLGRQMVHRFPQQSLKWWEAESAAANGNLRVSVCLKIQLGHIYGWVFVCVCVHMHRYINLQLVYTQSELQSLSTCPRVSAHAAPSVLTSTCLKFKHDVQTGGCFLKGLVYNLPLWVYNSCSCLSSFQFLFKVDASGTEPKSHKHEQ